MAKITMEQLKPTRSVMRIVSMVLVVALVAELAVVGFKYPGFLRKKEDDAPQLSEESFVEDESSGVSEIKLTKEDYAVEPECVTVSASDGCCQLESGVTVDFGNNTAICAGKELAVRNIGGRADERYEAQIYDLSLTDISAFSAPVEITLPYDKSWGKNVFVQYYNEETGTWEVLWTETDGEGNAMFSTGHFSTFAVFRDMVTGKKPVTDDGPVIVFLKDPSKMEKDTYCYINYAALAYQVKNGGEISLAELGNPSDTYWAERTMSIVNNTGGAAGYAFDAANFVSGGSAIYKGASKALGVFGYVMTAAKIFTQYHRTGDMMGAISDNKADIAGNVLSVAAEMTAGGVSTVLGAAALALFIGSTVQSAAEDVNLLGCENETEYAYRVFTGDYATCIMNNKGVFCSYKYAPTDYENLAYQTWNKDEVPLTTHKGMSASDWVTPLMFISEHYSYENIPKAVDNLLTQYVNIFWNVERNDPQTFDSFLENTKSVYKTPSKAKRKEYTERYKADMYAWLMPHLNEIMEKAYFEMLNSVFAEAQKLEKSLNTQLAFTLADAKCDSFAESEYAAYDCALALSENGEAIWHFSPDENWTLSCSRLMYMYAGIPAYVKVTNGTETVLTKKFTLNGDSVTITLGEAEEPEETLLTEPEGDGEDAYWALSEVVYLPEYSDLDQYAVGINGEPEPWIGPHTLRETHVTATGARGTIEEIYENNPDNDCRMEWKVDFPSAILHDPSEFLYTLHGSDSFWQDEKYAMYWYCSLYPDRANIPFVAEEAPGTRTFSGEGIVPEPKEGGNRLIMISFLDVGLVYRECSFADSLDIEPKIVEANPYDYWKNELGQE